MDPSSRRMTGISGIVFVVLTTAVFVLTGEGDFSQSDAQVRDFFVDSSRQDMAFAALVLLPIAMAALLWFVAGVRGLLRGGDGGGGGLPSAAALGGGVFAATFLASSTVSNAVPAALAFTDNYVFAVGIARLTLVLGLVLATVALGGGAVLVAATSLAGQRTGLLPRWFAISGYVVAVLCLFSLLLFAWPYALFGLWILTFSIMLLRAPRTTGEAGLPDQRAEEAPRPKHAAEPGVGG
ncbi:MAG: hypothetical protein ACRDV1_03735 [Actinomycetes bacterium]